MSARFQDGYTQYELAQALHVSPFRIRQWVRLGWLTEQGVGDVSRLPHTVKTLLENLLRRSGSRDVSDEDVRALARAAGLRVWDKPASPCLSSRIAYGLPVTPEALAQVERGEEALAEAVRLVSSKHPRTISRRFGVDRSRAHILPGGLVLLAEVQRRLGVPLDDRGRIEVDERLRVRGLPDVWAIGDAAAVPDPRGGACPPTARGG